MMICLLVQRPFSFCVEGCPLFVSCILRSVASSDPDDLGGSQQFPNFYSEFTLRTPLFLLTNATDQFLKQCPPHPALPDPTHDEPRKGSCPYYTFIGTKNTEPPVWVTKGPYSPNYTFTSFTKRSQWYSRCIVVPTPHRPFRAGRTVPVGTPSSPRTSIAASKRCTLEVCLLCH